MPADHPQVIAAVKCPKCGHAVTNHAAACPACGVDFAGYRRFLAHTRPAAEWPNELAFVGEATTLLVQQKEDALRIFTGWPTRNHYIIADPQGTPLAYLAERDTGWGWLSRLFFRQNRAFTFDVAGREGQPLLQLVRPFAWFFPRLEVIDATSGRTLGFVQKRFGWIRNLHHLCDERGVPRALLRSSLLGGRTLGDAVIGNQAYALLDEQGGDTGAFIARTWNGVLYRMFTDQDTYCVEFGAQISPLLRVLLLGAAICIDFESFEKEKESTSDRLGLLGALVSLLGGNRRE